MRTKATRKELIGAGALVLCVVLWLFNHYGAFERKPLTPAPPPDLSASVTHHESYSMHTYTVRVTGNGSGAWVILSPMGSNGKAISETLKDQKLPATYTRRGAYCSAVAFNPLPRQDEWLKVELERDGMFVAVSSGPDSTGAYRAEHLPKISDRLSK